MNKYAEFQVCQSYVVALVYGDFSGLSDEECELVENFIDSLPSGVWCEYSAAESQFCKDSVSGLMADCVDVTVWSA